MELLEALKIIFLDNLLKIKLLKGGLAVDIYTEYLEYPRIVW